MKIDPLKTLLIPPRAPVETPGSENEWQMVEGALGIKLPSDYKEFISTYGTGRIDNFLWVSNPFSKNKYLNFVNQIKPIIDGLSVLKKENVTVDYPLFPEKGGLLPWGASDNGDVFYWLCKNSPNDWRTVGHDGRVWQWQAFDLSATELLTKILSKQLIVDFFSEEFPSSSPKFVPLNLNSSGNKGTPGGVPFFF